AAQRGPNAPSGFAFRGLNQIVLGPMSIDQNLTRCVLEIEPDASDISCRMGPVPATLISHPSLNINLIEKARSLGDGAQDGLLALGLTMDLRQAHRNAANRDLGSIGQHPVLPVDAKPLEEPEETGAEPHHNRNLEIRAMRRHAPP